MDAKQVFTLLDKIDYKLDKVDARLNNIDIRLAKYNAELEFHIARTNQVEDLVVPIVEHVTQLRGAAKFITIVAAALGLAATIYGVWKP